MADGLILFFAYPLYFLSIDNNTQIGEINDIHTELHLTYKDAISLEYLALLSAS